MRIQTKHRLLVLQFLITTAMVVAEVPQTAFQSLRFEAALKQAELERKIVFADFYTTWCGPCKKLDQETWKDPAVISLLREKTIALRIDAEKEPELASRFKVNAYPTLALIRPDGTLIDSLVGYRDAPTFSKEFAAILAGKTQFALAREALEKAGADVEKQVKARYDLGRVLAQKGDDAGSLKEFLWCFDDGMKNHPAYAGVRVSFLLNDLARLGAHYPPALDALRVRRDADRTRFADDRSVALEFGSLNHALGEDQVTLAAFDQLPADNVQREVLGHQVFDLLLAAKRYPEAAAASPFAEYTAHFDMVRPGKSLYGYSVENAPASQKLMPVMKVDAPVVLIKRINKGGTCGYGRTFQAKRETRIGLLPLGYGDGYPRELSNTGTVDFRGKSAPVIGRVSMDLTIIDLTDIPEATTGSKACVFSNQRSALHSIESVACRLHAARHQ